VNQLIVAENLSTDAVLSPNERDIFNEIEAGFDENPFALSADNVEQVAFARGAAAAEALGILAMRQSGELAQVPAVDAIGGAKRYVEYSREYGVGTPEALHYLDQVDEDVRTMLFEALYAWGFVSETTKTYDPKTGHFLAGNYQFRKDILRSGLSSNLIDWEQERRGAEYVEEATLEAMVSSGVYKDYSLITFSMHPRKVGAKYLGYREENMKMMMRYSDIHDSNGLIIRTDHQASCDGPSLATIKGFYARLGIDTKLVEDEAGVLRLQALVPKNGIGFYLQLLDEVQGDNSFMLRRGKTPSKSDYDDLVNNSKKREEQVIAERNRLKQVVLEMAEHGYETLQARKLLGIFVEDLVHEICRDNPEFALYAFDQKTYNRYSEAAALRSSGRHVEADAIEHDAREFAPAISYCGGAGDPEMADKIGGYAREATAEEIARFGDTVYEGGTCLHCATSPTMVGQHGYCGPCADDVCGDQNEESNNFDDRNLDFGQIVEELLMPASEEINNPMPT